MTEVIGSAEARYSEFIARRLCDSAASKVVEIQKILETFARGEPWSVGGAATPEIAQEKMMKLLRLQNQVKKKLASFPSARPLSADEIIGQLEEMLPKLVPPKRVVKWSYSIGNEPVGDIEVDVEEKKEAKPLCPHGVDINPDWPCARCKDAAFAEINGSLGESPKLEPEPVKDPGCSTL